MHPHGCSLSVWPLRDRNTTYIPSPAQLHSQVSKFTKPLPSLYNSLSSIADHYNPLFSVFFNAMHSFLHQISPHLSPTVINSPIFLGILRYPQFFHVTRTILVTSLSLILLHYLQLFLSFLPNSSR